MGRAHVKHIIVGSRSQSVDIDIWTKFFAVLILIGAGLAVLTQPNELASLIVMYLMTTVIVS